MKRKILIKIYTLLLFGLLVISSCTKVDLLEKTAFDLLIGEYLESKPDTFSMFVEMMKKSNTFSFIKAYGTYTLFAPTNNAVKKFLNEKGKNTIDEFSIDELKDIVRYHILKDTLNSSMFADGKLRTPNMYGHYLIVGTYFEEGRTIYKINKSVPIIEIDIKAANGRIHVIDKVIEPEIRPLAKVIEENNNLSIFLEALKITGLYDTLMIISDKNVAAQQRRWFTVLATPDNVYFSEGINSIEDLKQKYCNTGDPTNPEDSLYLYVAYHILDNSLKYIGDIITQQVHATKAYPEIITVRLKNDSVLINEDEFMGVLEKGSPIIRDLSDNSAANGVYHILGKDIFIKVRFPVRIYWDVCDQPELRRIYGFRKPGSTIYLTQGQLADITWGGTDKTLKYVCYNNFWADYLTYKDCFAMEDAGHRFRTSEIPWIEFKTPVIVKGKYKVWICTRNSTDGADQNRRPKFMVYFNDEPLPIIINTGIQLSESISDEVYLVQGFKRYNYNPADSTTLTDPSGRWVAQLAGTIEVPMTGRHKIKFVVMNNGDKGFWIDMIQFIPVEEDQLWPRIDNEGILRDKPYWYPKQ